MLACSNHCFFNNSAGGNLIFFLLSLTFTLVNILRIEHEEKPTYIVILSGVHLYKTAVHQEFFIEGF